MNMKLFKVAMLATFFTLGLAACDDGPAEQVGEELDEAADTIREGEESMQNKLDDAADELQ